MGKIDLIKMGSSKLRSKLVHIEPQLWSKSRLESPVLKNRSNMKRKKVGIDFVQKQHEDSNKQKGRFKRESVLYEKNTIQ